jgi:hypothetical protein
VGISWIVVGDQQAAAGAELRMPDEDTAQASAPGSVPSVHGTRPIRIHRHGPAGDLARQAWKPPSRLVCSTSPALCRRP